MPKIVFDTSPAVAQFKDSNPLMDGVANLASSLWRGPQQRAQIEQQVAADKQTGLWHQGQMDETHRHNLASEGNEMIPAHILRELTTRRVGQPKLDPLTGAALAGPDGEPVMDYQIQPREDADDNLVKHGWDPETFKRLKPGQPSIVKHTQGDLWKPPAAPTPKQRAQADQADRMDRSPEADAARNAKLARRDALVKLIPPNAGPVDMNMLDTFLGSDPVAIKHAIDSLGLSPKQGTKLIAAIHQVTTGQAPMPGAVQAQATPAAAPPTAQAAPAGKTASMQAIQQKATAKGWDVQRAANYYQQLGYQIVP